MCNEINSSFIENELVHLLANDKVTEILVFGANNSNIDKFKSDKLKYLDCEVSIPGISIFSGLNLLFYDFISHPLWYIKQLKIRLVHSRLRNAIRKTNLLLQKNLDKEIILYSYWADYESLILALLKNKGMINLAITRLHAFDIYEYGDNHGHIPFRKFVYKKLDMLMPVSIHGHNYLGKYELKNDKIRTMYLGTNTANLGLNVCSENNVSIASCGWVGERKNIFGIFYAFRNEINVTWSHFGIGDDFNKLSDLIINKKSNLKTNLYGSVTQDQLRLNYSEVQFSCFISLSTNEGLPVSMMEAMAHGIPVVSTDVGGCSEIVNENTGVLLPKNYTDEDVRKAVYLCAEKFSSREARQKIQDFIKDNFDAEKNYGKFVDFLEAENKKHHEKL